MVARPSSTPVTSFPVIVTDATWPDVDLLHELGERDHAVALVWKLAEKFQISTPTTTSTIQNSRLLSVEFKRFLPSASRLPRRACRRVTRNSSSIPWPATHTIRSRRRRRAAPGRAPRAAPSDRRRSPAASFPSHESERTKPVARPPSAHRQAPTHATHRPPLRRSRRPARAGVPHQSNRSTSEQQTKRRARQAGPLLE